MLLSQCNFEKLEKDNLSSRTVDPQPDGSISIFPLPDITTPGEMTEVVKENNSFAHMIEQQNQKQKSNRAVAVPQFPSQKSHFKHVIHNS